MFLGGDLFHAPYQLSCLAPAIQLGAQTDTQFYSEKQNTWPMPSRHRLLHLQVQPARVKARRLESKGRTGEQFKALCVLGNVHSMNNSPTRIGVFSGHPEIWMMLRYALRHGETVGH